MSDERPTLRDYAWLRDVINGHRIDLLPILNSYQEIDEDILARNFSDLSEDQLKAVSTLRNAPGGIALINGVSGTGKTFFIKKQCRVILEQRAEGGEDNRLKIQILCARYLPLVDLGIAVKNEISDISIDGKPPLVVHVRSLDEEIDINQRERNTGETRQNKVSRFEYGFLDEILGLTSDTRAMQEKVRLHETKGKDSMPDVMDNRTESYKLSLGYWVLVVSGILETSDSATWKEERKFMKFAYLWKRPSRSSEPLSPQESVEFTEEINRVISHVLSLATVCLTTFTNGGSARMWNSYFPTHQIIEEGTKADNFCLPQVLAGYEKAYSRVFFGDKTQPHPIYISDRMFNNTTRDSLFVRLERFGFPTVTFDRQHRFQQKIAMFLKRLFYPNSVIVDCGKRPFTENIAAVFKKKWNLDNPLVFLDNKSSKSTAHPDLSGEVNLSNADVAFDAIKAFLEEGIPPGEILYLVPDQAQQQGRTRDREMLSQMLPGVHDFVIDCQTFEQFQRSEKTVIILDWVNTNELGTIKDSHLVQTATTRGRDALVMIGCPGAWQNDPRYNSSKLRELVGLAKSMHVIKEVDFPEPSSRSALS